MKEKNDPRLEKATKSAKINELRKDLADKMIPLFGEYTIEGGTYVFEPSLSKIGNKLGFDPSHISRALSPQNPLTKNQYERLIKVVEVLIEQKNKFEKEIEELKKETQTTKKTEEQKDDIENLKKEIREQKQKIQALTEAKKPVIDKSSIESVIWAVLLAIIAYFGVIYYRNDIINHIDSFRAIREFNNGSEELIFYEGKIESRPIDTSDVYEYPDLKSDTIVFSNKGIKILKSRTILLPKKE